MKITAEIVLNNNNRLPVSCEVKTLKDIAKLGNKLAAIPKNVKRVFPDLAAEGVKSLKVSVD